MSFPPATGHLHQILLPSLLGRYESPCGPAATACFATAISSGKTAAATALRQLAGPRYDDDRRAAVDGSEQGVPRSAPSRAQSP